MTWVTVAGFFWFLSGFLSFVYWWTKDNDITPATFLLGVFVSTLGPIDFLIGWALHGEQFVIFKRRSK